jgi:hypothetical protein
VTMWGCWAGRFKSEAPADNARKDLPVHQDVNRGPAVQGWWTVAGETSGLSTRPSGSAIGVSGAYLQKPVDQLQLNEAHPFALLPVPSSPSQKLLGPAGPLVQQPEPGGSQISALLEQQKSLVAVPNFPWQDPPSH